MAASAPMRILMPMPELRTVRSPPTASVSGGRGGRSAEVGPQETKLSRALSKILGDT